MIREALTFALKQLALPSGRGLWLCCAPVLETGDVYSPWLEAVRAGTSKENRFHSSIDTLAQKYDYVIVNATKQLLESEGLLALALERSTGFVLIVAPKDAGGGRLAAMMDAYGVAYGELSKSRCRIVWTNAATQAKPAEIAKNISNLAMRSIKMDAESWWTVPGLFGWDKIDTGSRLLLQHLPLDLKGDVADFGCGYGYICANLARHAPHVEKIDAYDADARAVAVCGRNGGEKVHSIWQDIRGLDVRRRYDSVVMNPPFHTGKREDIDLGETFILKAWESLKPRGRLFFVANRQLPYEKIVKGLTILHEGEGFKIITGQRT